MIYIASPYMHPNPAIVQQRFDDVCKFVARIQGELSVPVFSPIVHSHSLVGHGIRSDWWFWESIDKQFIDLATMLIVLKLDGWKNSVGVEAEVEYAFRNGVIVIKADENTTIEEIKMVYGFKHIHGGNYSGRNTIPKVHEPPKETKSE